METSVGTESNEDNPVMEESSWRHGTIIPVIGSNRVGTCCHQGRRTYQEDKFIVMQLGAEEEEVSYGRKPSNSTKALSNSKNQKSNTSIMLLAVFDGHGGDECSNYCQENLHRYVKYCLFH